MSSISNHNEFFLKNRVANEITANKYKQVIIIDIMPSSPSTITSLTEFNNKLLIKEGQQKEDVSPEEWQKTCDIVGQKLASKHDSEHVAAQIATKTNDRFINAIKSWLGAADYHLLINMFLDKRFAPIFKLIQQELKKDYPDIFIGNNKIKLYRGLKFPTTSVYYNRIISKKIGQKIFLDTSERRLQSWSMSIDSVISGGFANPGSTPGNVGVICSYVFPIESIAYYYKVFDQIQSFGYHEEKELIADMKNGIEAKIEIVYVATRTEPVIYLATRTEPATLNNLPHAYAHTIKQLIDDIILMPSDTFEARLQNDQLSLEDAIEYIIAKQHLTSYDNEITHYVRPIMNHMLNKSKSDSVQTIAQEFTDVLINKIYKRIANKQHFDTKKFFSCLLECINVLDDDTRKLKFLHAFYIMLHSDNMPIDDVQYNSLKNKLISIFGMNADAGEYDPETSSYVKPVFSRIESNLEEPQEKSKEDQQIIDFKKYRIVMDAGVYVHFLKTGSIDENQRSAISNAMKDKFREWLPNIQDMNIYIDVDPKSDLFAIDPEPIYVKSVRAYEGKKGHTVSGLTDDVLTTSNKTKINKWLLDCLRELGLFDEDELTKQTDKVALTIKELNESKNNLPESVKSDQDVVSVLKYLTTLTLAVPSVVESFSVNIEVPHDQYTYEQREKISADVKNYFKNMSKIIFDGNDYYDIYNLISIYFSGVYDKQTRIFITSTNNQGLNLKEKYKGNEFVVAANKSINELALYIIDKFVKAEEQTKEKEQTNTKDYSDLKTNIQNAKNLLNDIQENFVIILVFNDESLKEYMQLNMEKIFKNYQFKYEYKEKENQVEPSKLSNIRIDPGNLENKYSKQWVALKELLVFIYLQMLPGHTHLTTTDDKDKSKSLPTKEEEEKNILATKTKLLASVSDWNKWRKYNPDEKIDLHQADLTGANLSEADLSKANLSGVDLYGANLIVANLSGANLSGAYLIKANLDGAYLHEANLSEAKLQGANLREAYMLGADLYQANLKGADLYRANLTVANLSGANLSKADLAGANLRWANLSEANLGGVNLKGANLSKANLSKANLSEANLKGANLSGANLHGAKLSSKEQLSSAINIDKAESTDQIIYQENKNIKSIGGIIYERLISPNDLPNHNQDAWKKYLDAVETYLHGGGISSQNDLLALINNDLDVQHIIQEIQNLCKYAWEGNTKKIYRGMGITTKERVVGMHGDRVFRLKQSAMNQIALQKPGSVFRFKTPIEYKLQHWTPNYSVAKHFADHQSFLDWHDPVVISTVISWNKVIFDVNIIPDDVIASRKMIKYVKKEEKEIVVLHDAPIECTMVFNEYWMYTKSMKTKQQAALKKSSSSKIY